MQLNESQTRALLINPLLVEAGWKLSDRTQVRFEVPVEGYDPTPWNGITDFCLYHPSGRVLSVVEAKRTSRNPREGEEQLRQYVVEIANKQDFAPFGFMSNGLNTCYWEVGLAHPRLVAGFFTPADLERLLFIRQNRQPFAGGAINNSIVDRPYQHEAIRRVCETFDKGKRRALLVMATGTGKTRTVIPEVVNLVFMKPVQSRIKLWQMIGRGTRNHEACKYHSRLPDGQKTEFLIIDFWQNDFGKQTDEGVSSEIPVLVRVFNTRLDLLAATLNNRADFAHKQAVGDCRVMLNRIPRDSFPVRKVWGEIDEAWSDQFWALVTQDKINWLRLKVGPLLRFASDVDVAAETFTNKVERLKLQLLRGRPTQELLESIADDVSRLPSFVHDNAAKNASINLVLSSAMMQATPQQLTQVITDLADEMKNRRDRPSAFLKLDLPDFVVTKGYLIVKPGQPPVHVEEYRQRVEQRIQQIADTHPALAAIREGCEPSEEQLVDLERVLHDELSGGEIQLSPDLIRKAYGLRMDNRLGFLGFVRHVLELDTIPDYEAVVARGFQSHITSRNYTGDQIRFLRSVQEVFLAKRRLSEADLYEPPLTNFGRNAVERFFTPAEIKEIVALTDQLAA